MASVFTMIIDGDLPARFVWKDAECVGFLSINPLSEGHVLVVPREEVDHWVDAHPDLLAHLTRVGQTIGMALQQTYDPVKVGLMIAGLEVPHLHIHVVPINSVTDLDFANADPDPDPAALDAAAEKVRSALREMGIADVPD